MPVEQLIVFTLLGLVLALFIWGRWRYDLIAIFALLVVSISGIVSPADAFSGFGHPAVITVAAVLIVSRGLFNSGLVDYIVRFLSRAGDNPIAQLTVLVLAVTICSGFMNNIAPWLSLCLWRCAWPVRVKYHHLFF
jgi:di/tricarboxylate transporter